MLSLAGMRKSYGVVAAVDGAELAVPAGSLVAVLGPSGCGKTTLLRCVAGFERISGGTITLDGRPVAGNGIHLPPHRRKVTVVPQEGALFPHLPVAANVGYGLDRTARRSGRVDELLALVGLTGYGDRMPHQLSGGQQQRVAVARALAPRPPLVLLDEPFSALDAALRAELRRDVQEALRAAGATAVLVTHDQAEALSMADQVAVMRAGRIVQQGTPATIYRDPVDPWVASFVGEAVLIPAMVEGGLASSPLGPLPVTDPTFQGPATALVRPEQIRLRRAPAAADPATMPAGPATVVRHDFHGHDALVRLRLHDGTLVTARVFDAAAPLAAGDEVMVTVDGPARVFGG
jgi:iron(III) transport system ATP-binding protein